MNILITGGAGFIGSHLAEYFQGKATVTILDNFRTGKRDNLKGLSVKLIEGSIVNKADVEKAVEGVDYVFHMAAQVSVPESVHNPLECLQINGIGLLNVLEASAQAGVKKLCFSSSSAVYGENPASPKHENLSPDPRSPYALTKLDGEYYCAMYAALGRLKTTSLRYFNVYGPRQDPVSAYAAAIPIFLKKAQAGEALTIFGDGLQTRDFVFVKDIVAANVFAMTSPELTGVYNVGGGKSITIKAIAERIIELTKSSSSIQYQGERPGDVKHSCADADKLAKAGFTPRWDLERGLHALVSI
jgi:UDP-glucose 4-epimerase